MSLKFKRSVPIIILLITFLTFLVLVLGEQPIVAYGL